MDLYDLFNAYPVLTGEMEQTKRIDDAEETQGTILLNCSLRADAAMFLRFMYMFAANSGWPRSGKQNGLKKKDLFSYSL